LNFLSVIFVFSLTTAAALAQAPSTPGCSFDSTQKAFACLKGEGRGLIATNRPPANISEIALIFDKYSLAIYMADGKGLEAIDIKTIEELRPMTKEELSQLFPSMATSHRVGLVSILDPNFKLIFNLYDGELSDGIYFRYDLRVGSPLDIWTAKQVKTGEYTKTLQAFQGANALPLFPRIDNGGKDE
jgi:hypothetical protein